jgi:hypothetical protein
MTRLQLGAGIATIALLGVSRLSAPIAGADPVRPGYGFANADAALSYGRGICDEVSAGRSYALVMGDVKSHLATSDEYQASYLISQAINELCPTQIWQLRNSAAHYRPPAGG